MILIIIFLAIVQAITEFLPISSSGHLILFKDLFHIDSDAFGITFDIMLHFGTLFALLIYFRKEVKDIFLGLFNGKDKSQLGYKIMVATIPALAVGFIFNGFIEEYLRNNVVVAINLLVVGGLLLMAEKFGKKTKEVGSITFLQAFIIGIFQSLALAPGVSRSGATISSAMFLGQKRDEAARFSFLLSIPAISLASLKGVIDIAKTDVSAVAFDSYILGFVVSFIGSLVVISFLLKYLKNHSLKVFAYYRFILAICVLAVIIF